MLDRSRSRRLVRHGRGEISIGELLEQSAANTAHRSVLAGAVERHEHADALIHEQHQLTVEDLRVAAMLDDALAVAVRFEEAERHAVDRAASLANNELCMRRAVRGL